MPDPGVFFNGVDGVTGGYLLPALTPADVSRLALGEPLSPGYDPKHRKELKYWRQRNAAAILGPKEGVDPKKLVDACASAADTNYIATSVTPQLLSYTRLIGPGETAEAPFTAPAVRGDYVFVCTFPGHFALGMRGVLTVK